MSLKASILRRVPSAYQSASRYWWRRVRGTLEPEVDTARRLARAGSVVIDVGANTGIYSYALSGVARVHAFEPFPPCVEILKGLRNRGVEVHAEALSDRPGSATLYIPRINGRLEPGWASFSRPQGEVEEVNVPVTTLDSFDFRNVSLIKIDVEGHEQAVIKGAHATIEREGPALIIEIEQRHIKIPIGSVFDEILSHGYTGFFLDTRQLPHPLEEFRIDQHQRLAMSGDVDWQSEVFLDPQHGYVNNFIFLPASDPRVNAL